jgi:hypothetical protein
MLESEVGEALMQAHARANSQARCGLNRFFRILNLKVQKNIRTGTKELVVAGTEEEEEDGEDTEDEEEEGKDTEVQDETEGGQMVRRMAL